MDKNNSDKKSDSKICKFRIENKIIFFSKNPFFISSKIEETIKSHGNQLRNS